LNNSQFYGILAVNRKEFTENKEDLLNIGEEGGLVCAAVITYQPAQTVGFFACSFLFIFIGVI